MRLPVDTPESGDFAVVEKAEAKPGIYFAVNTWPHFADTYLDAEQALRIARALIKEAEKLLK